MAVSEEYQTQLMAYLDGELTPEERQRFERILMATPELQQELEQFQRLQAIVQRVRIPEPKPELWDERARRAPEKICRIVGWVFFVLGCVIVALASEYLLWSANDIPWILKLGLTFIVGGLGVLLASVLYRRCQEGKTDRYKEIVR